jgi:hypothetical protein
VRLGSVLDILIHVSCTLQDGRRSYRGVIVVRLRRAHTRRTLGNVNLMSASDFAALQPLLGASCCLVLSCLGFGAVLILGYEIIPHFVPPQARTATRGFDDYVRRRV